jgi:flagellar hook-associated protein 3 FlgL
VTFEAVVSSLNTSVGGRSLLSGTATGSTPLASASDMMSDIMTLASAEVTAAGAISVVENWFDAAGGGFDTSGYLGSDTHLSPFSLGENETANLQIKADDDAIRNVLKGLALASLVEKGMFENDVTQQAFILQTAGESLLSSQTNILSLQADLGVIEEQIDDSQISLSSELSALELAKSDIVSVDLYETATKLTQAETQLELIYTITARLSQLKLSDYL